MNPAYPGHSWYPLLATRNRLDTPWDGQNAAMTTDPTRSATPGGTSAPQNGGSNKLAHMYEQKSNMYKVAFEESVRALKDQVDELSGIRQRLVQYLAFMGSATAFLVGSSLGAADRDGVFYGLACGGTALMIITIGCTVYLLWPSMSQFGATSSAQTIIREMIERKLSPIQNDGQFYHDFATYNDQAVDENEKALRKTRRFYFAAIVCGALQLTVWVALVWLRG